MASWKRTPLDALEPLLRVYEGCARAYLGEVEDANIIKYPHYAKFARLTRQEEKHGLLDETATIGTSNGWAARLQACGLALKGHRVVRLVR